MTVFLEYACSINNFYERLIIMSKLFFFVINILIVFFIDLFCFFVLIKCGMNPLWARVFSIGTAYLAIWICGRFFVFAKLKRRSFVEAVRCGVISIFSAVLNYAVYATLLIFDPILQLFVAVILSSISATIFAFFLYTRFICRESFSIRQRLRDTR
ncbi:MAG: hypothetical protein EU981_01280 [Candidatus Liberibacter ctenarytainae]|uniref:GtrA/DPMS transmembrane domain-containing protein n=1 Tax=Candidatus Liberibacter ctenarytainae TaxID=2020335 RepID=A0A937AIL1_9HYPH|nr:hypothetical protein [Candidatus Liberibacter ctenarytainae]